MPETPSLADIYASTTKPSLDDIYGEPLAPAPASPEPSGFLRRAVADPALALLKGAIGLPEAAVGLADIATGGYAGKGAEALGFRPKEAKQIIDTWMSPELQQAKANVQEAQGFLPTVAAMVENPSTIVEAAAESAPSMIGGAGVARGILKFAPKVATAVAAGIGEGVVTAGQSAEQIRQETESGTLGIKQTVLPVVAGAITGALGIAGGKVASKLGIGDIDTLLARGAGENLEEVAKNKNLLRRVAEGAFSEGILEELPQSAQEQVAQNLALNKPWNEGVAEAAAAGMLVGGLMGVTANVRPAPAKQKAPLATVLDALKESLDPTTETGLADALENAQVGEAAKVAEELAPQTVAQAVEDDKIAEALNLQEPVNKPIEPETPAPQDLSTPLSTPVENLDLETGELTPAPTITDPLDAYRGYSSEKSALRARGGIDATQEVVQRPSDGLWVRKAKEVVKLYRGELPFKEGGVTGESKGVKTGDFWTPDKGTAEYFAGDKGSVLEATLKPTAKVLDLETADGQKEYERITGRAFDGYHVAEQGVSGYTEDFKKAGYDVIHSIDIDGPETLVLNHDALEKAPITPPKNKSPQPITPNQVKGSISVYNVDDVSALGYDSDTGVYTLREKGPDGPVDVATYEVINGKIQNFKTNATAQAGFDREQQIQEAQSLVERIEAGRGAVKLSAKGLSDVGRDENTVGSEVAGRDGGAPTTGAERPVNNPLLNADGSNKYSAEDVLRVAEKEIESVTGKRLPAGSLRVVPGTDHLSVKLNKISTAWGKKVVVFEAASGVTGAPGGFRSGLTADTLYINKNAQNPHLVVLGHELTHAIEAESGELYAEFEKVVREELNTAAYAQYVADYNKMHLTNYTGDSMTSEAIAETVGHLLGSPEFLQSMHETHPTLFQKIMKLIHDLLEPIISANYHAKLTAQIYKDYSRIYKEASKMLSEYEATNKGAGGTQFSAASVPYIPITDATPSSQMKFSVSLNDVEKTAKAVTAQFKKFPYGQVLEDVATSVYRFIMPIDRAVTLAASQKTFAPIKSLLTQFVRQRKEKAGRIQSDMTDGAHIWKRFEKNFKTDAEVQNFSDMVWNATEYELHADGAASGWTAESWEEAGMLERTGKSLGQAKKIVSDGYKKLSPEQKIVHQEMLHHVQQMYMAGRQAELAWMDQAEVKKAEAWLLNEEGEAPELADLVKEINEHYPTLRGDYMPLMRFGSLIVRTYEKDENGELGDRTRTEFFDSPQAAKAYVEMINKTPGKHAKLETNPEYRKDVVNIPASLVDKISKAAEKQGITGEALEDLKQSIEGIRANMLPRNSIASSKLHREGVAGYEKDVIRVYLTYVRNHALANAQLTHGAKIEQTFRDMRNKVDAISSEPDYDVEAVRQMSTLADHLYDVEKSGSREKVNEFTKTVGKVTFAWYLTSPSVFAVQWSQPFMVTIPKMGARHGFSKAFAAYTQAAKRFLHGDFSDDKIDEFDRNHEYVGQRVADILDRSREATGAERKALDAELKSIYNSFKGNDQRLLILKVLSHQGQIDLAMAHNAQDIVAGAKGGEKVFNSIIDKAAFFMQKSETGSRRAAAISAFELQFKGDNFTEANDYATHIISDTLMDFDAQNRGAAWRGNTGRILGQFQFFRMHMVGKLAQLTKDAIGGEYKRAMAEATTQEEKDAAAKAMNEARKEFAYVMGSSFALAGAAGTPLALLLGNTGMSALWGALAFLFGDDDDPWDPQREFELATREALGDTAGNVVLKGLPSLVGADISRRIGLGGMGDVISGEPPAGLTGTAKANWYAGRILGPSWGMVSDTIRASDALADGDLSMAMRYGSPKVMRDVVKMFNVADKGVEAGGKTLLKPEDVSVWSMALMLSGINPTEVSLAQEESRYLKNISTELSQRRSGLIKHLAEATVDQDLDAKDEAIEKINKWSETNPSLKITQQELVQKIKKVRDGRAGKLTKREALIQDEFGKK